MKNIPPLFVLFLILFWACGKDDPTPQKNNSTDSKLNLRNRTITFIFVTNRLPLI